MDYKKLYAEKLVSAEKAASVVKSGDWVDYGWTTGTPVAVDAAIAKRLPELDECKLPRRYPDVGTGDLQDRKPGRTYDLELLAHERYREKGDRTGIQLLCSDPLFRASEILSVSPQTKPDVAVFQVAPMDEHGYFNFGPNASHMAACLRDFQGCHRGGQ